MNHLVPEQMFSTETEKAQGISAVKALAIASQQGQKIWTITNDNVNLALSRINLGAEAENDIRNAVNAGKIATAHETRINFNGWVGEGYTLIDQDTGAGVYMISGGGNGGVLVGIALALVLAMFIGFMFMLGPILAAGAASIAGLAFVTMIAIASVVGLLLKGFGIIFESTTACKISGYSYNAAIGGLFAYFSSYRLIKSLIAKKISSDAILSAFLTVIGSPTAANLLTDSVVGTCP
ncbi:hypothetical protein D0C16_12920 [Cellvibrio sp. KY-GH-1]|uniref:hypothetical protein n=1 Tax=Cellvibrio sp. KY-GH-1 TaxID=2303332 RepID=UPI0012484CCB|nr:hypothetical protein [Cellvibrio sp. KY-GH-1]QEY16793.1 hypothetical protein D0C16_12920 [Cellvibrio sp. KY-GH-1]